MAKRGKLHSHSLDANKISIFHSRPTNGNEQFHDPIIRGSHDKLCSLVVAPSAEFTTHAMCVTEAFPANARMKRVENFAKKQHDEIMLTHLLITSDVVLPRYPNPRVKLLTTSRS